MSALYTTLTSKGQITLPAEIRRLLGFRPGQKLAVRVEGDQVVIDRPESVESLRATLRAEAEAAGSWGLHPVAGDGWAARAEERHAQP